MSEDVVINREIDRLPTGWTWASVGDLTSECRRGRAPSYDGGQTAILNQKCVRGGMWLDFSHIKRTNEETKPIPDWAVLRDHDVVVNSTGAGTLGRVGFVREVPERLTADTHVCIVRPSAAIHGEFLALVLHVQEQALVVMGGGSTNQQELRPDDIAAMPVALPPLPEQERILAALQEDEAHLTAAAEELRRSQSDISVLRASVLAELGKTEAPLKTVGELGEVFVGATPKRAVPELWNGDVPWVSSGEVAFCRISKTRETITEAGLGNAATRLHPPGTILLAMIGEGKTRGQAAILDVAAAHNQNAASIRLDREKMLPDFLYLCFMRQYATSRALGRGGQQPALNKELVKAIEVPCPPLSVQQDLVDHITAALRIADESEGDIKLLERLAADARTALLRDALSGRVTVQDPNDEPAAVALERVRAQQGTTSPRRRRGRRAPVAA